MSEKIVQTAGREQLGDFAPTFAYLNDDVLFGKVWNEEAYQEWGKETIEMTLGTVINIPAEVKHWHGALPDSWFSHLAIEIPGEEGSTE